MFPLPRMIEYANIAPTKGNIKDFQVTSGAVPYNAYILYNNGQLYGFGSNGGLLGTGDTVAVSTWQLLATNVKMFSAGCTVCVYITNDNKAYATGRLNDTFPGKSFAVTSYTWTDVSAGFRNVGGAIDISTLRLVRVSQLQSSIFVVDNNDNLQTGGVNTSYITAQNSTSGSSILTAVTNGDHVKDVRSSKYCTIVLKTYGNVFIAGLNTNFNIGRGTNTGTAYGGLTEISTTGSNCTSIFVNEMQTSFIQDGIIRTAGKNSYTDGVGTTVQWPSFTDWHSSVKLPNDIVPNNIVHISVNTLKGWGENRMLQDGIGSTSYITKETACLSTDIIDTTQINLICGHANATYVVVNNESVYTCGLNTYTLLPASTGIFTKMPIPQ